MLDGAMRSDLVSIMKSHSPFNDDVVVKSNLKKSFGSGMQLKAA